MNTSLLISKVNVAALFQEVKEEGLRKRRPHFADNIITFEKMWEEYSSNQSELAYETLHNAICDTIKASSRILGYRWNNKRISSADFESKLFELFWNLCKTYKPGPEFYLVETFGQVIRKRQVDVVRAFTSRQRVFENEMTSFEKAETQGQSIASDVDIEKEFLSKELIQQIFTDDSLTQKERQLLQMIYDNPDSSYRKIADNLGLKSHKQVTRSLCKIKNKLFYIFS